MSIPGMNAKAAAPTTAGGAKKGFGGFGSIKYEQPPTGEKINAVCAERIFDDLPDFKTGALKTKLILCFQLEARKEDGTRWIQELKMFPGFTRSNKGGCDKHFRTWAGSAAPLTDEQKEEWTAAINGQSDFENGVIDPNPPLVGLNCQVMLEYNEAGTFVNIEKVFPPSQAQIDNPMTVDDKYVPYFERKKQRAERAAQNNNQGGNSARNNPPAQRRAVDPEEIPFN